MEAIRRLLSLCWLPPGLSRYFSSSTHTSFYQARTNNFIGIAVIAIAFAKANLARIGDALVRLNRVDPQPAYK